MKNILLNLQYITASAILLSASTTALAFNKSLIPDFCQKYVSELQGQFPDDHHKVVQSGIPYVISAFRQGTPACMSAVFEYPYSMPNPLTPIKNPTEMEERISEVIDNDIQLMIAKTTINDWSTVGWRGSMIDNGTVWVTESGVVTGINRETDARKLKIIKTLEAQQAYLHPSLHNFKEPILSWNSSRFNIRIDLLADDQYRYAVWKGSEPQSAQPDLILTNGEYSRVGGTLSYPEYRFTNGNYSYTVGQAWSPNWPDGKIGQLYVEQERSDGTSKPLTSVNFFEHEVGMPLPVNRYDFVKEFMNNLLAGKSLKGKGQTHIDYRHSGTANDPYSKYRCDRTYNKMLTNVPVEQFTEVLKMHLDESFKWEKENLPSIELLGKELPSVNSELMTPVEDTVSIEVISVTVNEPSSSFSFYFTSENGKDRLVQISRDNRCMP
jgi:hypothetical protein